MIKIFEFLWYGCWHKWSNPILRKINYDDGTDMQQAVYRCEKCNRFKVKDI